MSEDAPGLKIRTNKNGTRSGYWVAANCSRKAKHFPDQTIRLHGPEEGWPELCRQYRDQLIAWIEEQHQPAVNRRFNGTFSSLIDQYVGHELSPYFKVKPSTRSKYDWEHKQLRQTVGARALAKITGVDFIRWADNFSAPAKGKERRRVARSHDLMSAVRRVMGWGTVLELPHAARLNQLLGEMEFEGVAPRTALFTYEMAKAIIERANAVGRPSIALAQALQFELALRQIDVIGEWVVDLTSTSGIRNNSKNTKHSKRWESGLLWSHIDQELVLRKLISKTARRSRVVGEYDLKGFPLVMAELSRVPVDKRMGPVVVNEETALPYTGTVFRDVWRAIAKDAGVPANVQNRDSRSGGITETTDAGAPLEDARHLATHKNLSTTARYSRGTLQKNGRVAELRSLHRQSKNSKP